MPESVPAPIVLAVTSRTRLYRDRAVQAFAEALQVQIDRDYRPLWPDCPPVEVRFVPRTRKLDLKHWWLIFLENADQAGALGYHQLTAGGLPIGKAFVRTTLADGGIVSVTADHEALEMFGDPDIDRVFGPVAAPASWRLPLDPGPIVVIGENCDATEDDRFSYSIDSVKLSDFVTPAWFDPAAPVGTKFDFLGLCQTPLELLPGGYISYRDAAGGWHQVFGPRSPFDRPHKHAAAPARGTRLRRRLMPRSEWKRSTAR